MELKIKFSYIEIYNEMVRDLLSEKTESTNLMILEDANKNIIISDLTEKYIYTMKDVYKLIL